MPTSDGISSEDWNTVRDLVMVVITATTSDERSTSIDRLFAFLDELERRYGTRASILATRADFLNDNDQRVRMLEEAYSLAATQDDRLNMVFIAHSLAEFYLDDPPHPPNAQRWLSHMAEHLAAVDHGDMAARYERLRTRLEALGWT